MKMRRLSVVIALGLVLAASGACAQTPSKVYRIGLLSPLAPLADNNVYVAGLIRGLARHGHTLDRNLVFERRGAEMRLDRLPRFVEELVASKVDVIVTIGYPAALAAKQGTSTVPVVVIGSGDPVETGLVASLARPGGNVTGISEVATELSTKRLELLKEAVPSLRRVAMLWNANDLGMTLRYKAAAAAAQALGVLVQPLGVREPEDFDEAFTAMTHDAPDGILMVSDALTNLNRKRVFDFAAAHRLPAIYENKPSVRDGGLMSYGPDQGEMAVRAADLVDLILRGVKPADLPVEQPVSFELIVNLKTAKALGIDFPPSILVRADEAIE